jgi:hypothetical protein
MCSINVALYKSQFTRERFLITIATGYFVYELSLCQNTQRHVKHFSRSGKNLKENGLNLLQVLSPRFQAGNEKHENSSQSNWFFERNSN